MDPLKWLARMADHIPDTGKHPTHFYGFYASRVRVSRRETKASDVPAEPAPAKRRCPPSWARLIRKVYHADLPPVRGKLKVVAYVTGEITVKRILAGLGLSAPVEEKPPPIREFGCPCTTRGGRSRPPEDITFDSRLRS